MPPFGPLSRRELIRALRKAGYEGPISGGKHEYLEGRGHRLRIPNPHSSDIGPKLLSQLLKQAGISREEWEAID